MKTTIAVQIQANVMDYFRGKIQLLSFYIKWLVAALQPGLRSENRSDFGKHDATIRYLRLYFVHEKRGMNLLQEVWPRVLCYNKQKH